MTEKFDRRFFLNTPAAAAAAALFATSAEGQDARMAESFAALKRIDAGLLTVEYAEAGPANGPVVSIEPLAVELVITSRRKRQDLSPRRYRTCA